MPVRKRLEIRLRRGRQARELARLLLALDRAAGEVRPAPARRARLSLSK
jgi:hypothetical protein